MTQAINCPKENCNGVLEEGVRGFYKCTVCGAKVKKSLISADVPKTNIPKQPSVVIPVIENCVEHTRIGSSDPIVNAQPQVVNIISQVEVSQPKAEVPKIPKTPTSKLTTSDGILLVGKTTVINCVTCGTERTIKIQDAFQVKRCVECQKIYAKARRAERAKEKKQASTATV